MRVNINCLHPLPATICYPLSAYVNANAVSKSHHLHLRMWISILEYVGVIVNNRIRISFIYNIIIIIYIMLINSPNQHRFGVFGLAICYVH